GKMEIGEDQLTAAHVRPLALDRLLHLHDHVAVLPHRRRVGSDLRADGGEVAIRKAAAKTSARLDQQRMPSTHQRFSAGRNEGDTVLVGFDLFWYADLHVILASAASRGSTVPAPRPASGY